ncbi:MAG: substrate-binding domain-containing protein [Pseudomonadota bacterium]
MITRLAFTLLCSVAPAAIFAQQVDLRSPDEFISVEGEIVGFNGVMLRVQTNVGAISVPASEVICYGTGCLQTVQNNDFGLTADAFVDLVTVSAEEAASAAEAAAAATATSETLTVGIDGAAYEGLYRTLAGAYAVASDASNQIDFAPNADLTLTGPDQNETTLLFDADAGSDADVVVGPATLGGTLDRAYAGPADWASATQLSHHLIALDAFAVIVAPNADISAISVSDLARVFAGEVTNWSQIGGADVSVLPLQLPTDTVLNQEFVRLVMEPAGRAVAGNVLTIGTAEGVTASINQFPGSISVVDLADADPALTVDVAGACGIPVPPTMFHAKSGDYPLIRPIMAQFAAPRGTNLVTELFDFASRDVAQSLVAREGYVDYSASLQDAVAKNARLSSLLEADLDEAQRASAAQMFQVLFDADRTSLSLTGGAASGPEGGWNRAMFVDLLELMEDPGNAGREIVFVGFGESTAGSAAAIDASTTAAAEMVAAVQAVAADVVSANNLTLSSFGFGNVAPTTCYDGQVAGSEYTRIEVWIR